MKKCPNCHHENKDQNSFCEMCGGNLQQKINPAKRSKKKGWFIGVFLLMISMVLAVLFIEKSRTEQTGTGTFQEKIQMAEKYLEKLDYSKAEEYFLEAKDIDPKQLKPYEELYQIYTVKQLPEKADKIRELASENLSEKDFSAFRKTASAAGQKDEEPEEDQFGLVRELGSLDYPPMSIDGKSWLLIDQGKFSFLYPDGHVVNADGMNQMDLMVRMGPQSLNSAKDQLAACFFDEYYPLEPGLYEDGQYQSVAACGGGSPISDVPYTVDAQNRTVTVDPLALKAVEQSGMPDYYEMTLPVVAGYDSQLDGEYFIYSPLDQQLYGPYRSSETAVFYLLPKSMGFRSPYGMLQKAGSPFWSRDEKSSQITLHSLDGLKSESGFSEAMICDPFSIGAFKDSRFYLYDQDLKPVYDGNFEAGAAAIDGRAPVKIDGEWKLIDLDYGRDSEKQEEDNQEPSDPESLLRRMKGEYTDLANFDSSLLVFENGRIQGWEVGQYTDESAPEYPNGTIYEMDYIGQFEIMSLPQKEVPGKARLRNLQLSSPAHTEVVIDGTRHVYEDGKVYNLGENSVFLIYAPGTPYSKLPQDVADFLYPDADENKKTEDFILVQEDEHRRVCVKQD